MRRILFPVLVAAAVLALRIVTKEGVVYFLVEDTGIGVPPEQAEHIFEHFVQLDDYREGTGIGLSWPAAWPVGWGATSCWTPPTVSVPVLSSRCQSKGRDYHHSGRE